MTLLAVDAGVRHSGWAVFQADGTIHTGVIRPTRSRTQDTAGRVGHLLANLDGIATRWQPHALAYGQPSGIRSPEPSLELLDAALVTWAASRRLPLHTYPTQHVRAAIARHFRVPPDQLAFAIMQRMKLIGARKSTPEWEALAIGCYHLSCRPQGGRFQHRQMGWARYGLNRQGRGPREPSFSMLATG